MRIICEDPHHLFYEERLVKLLEQTKIWDLAFCLGQRRNKVEVLTQNLVTWLQFNILVWYHYLALSRTLNSKRNLNGWEQSTVLYCLMKNCLSIKKRVPLCTCKSSKFTISITLVEIQFSSMTGMEISTGILVVFIYKCSESWSLNTIFSKWRIYFGAFLFTMINSSYCKDCSNKQLLQK